MKKFKKNEESFNGRVKEKMQKEFEKLYKRYGLSNPSEPLDNLAQNRAGLSEDEERNFVDDCFDMYERIGFAETFKSIYKKDSELTGMKFSIIGRVKEDVNRDEGMELAFLPMWNIKLENGDTTFAFPEEICLVERMKR